MVQKKLLEQIINWGDSLSFPMNQTVLEMLCREKENQTLTQLSERNKSIPGLTEALEQISLHNVEKIIAHLNNHMNEKLPIGKSIMQKMSNAYLIHFCRDVAAFINTTTYEIYQIAEDYIGQGHELYPILELSEICEKLERAVISDAYSSPNIYIKQLRDDMETHISMSLQALNSEIHPYDTTRELWEKYNAFVKLETEKIRALFSSDLGNINESLINYQIRQLSERALHILHDTENNKAKNLIPDFESFLELRILDIVEGRLILFDRQYCKQEMKKLIARVVNYSLPHKKRVKHAEDIERIYRIMNFDREDIEEFYVETSESERLVILESIIKEWLRQSGPFQRLFSLLSLVIGFSNVWAPILNDWPDRGEIALELSRFSYNSRRREFLRKVTKNLFECSFDQQTFNHAKYSEWSVVILAENLIAKVLSTLGREDWVRTFVHENLAEQLIPYKGKSKSCKVLRLECCKQVPSLHVTLAISGWLSQKDDFIEQWDRLVNYSFQGRLYALRWDSSDLGSVFSKMFIAGGIFAVSGMNPFTLVPFGAYLLIVKSKFVEASKQAKFAGEALATFIKEDVFGKSPISLVAFSLGTSVVLYCLLKLVQERVSKVHDIVLLGGAAPLDVELWKRAKKAVSGRLINCYSKSDKILSKCYRLAMFKKAIGNSEIKVKGVDNYNVTHIAPGHFDYRDSLDKILQVIKYTS
jgi:hypothetical protein